MLWKLYPINLKHDYLKNDESYFNFLENIMQCKKYDSIKNKYHYTHNKKNNF